MSNIIWPVASDSAAPVLHHVFTIDTIRFGRLSGEPDRATFQTILIGVPTIDRRETLRDRIMRYPYGRWLGYDGRITVFDRRYHPMIHIMPDHAIEPADPLERIKFDKATGECNKPNI